MTRPETGLLRLVAQRLAGGAEATAADAVGHLTAAQAQHAQGAVTSIALRSAARSRADVRAAYDDGLVVKSWPMRGTLHLVAAEDLPWMLELLTPRVLSGAKRRRAELGIDDATIERAAALTEQALGGGRALRREELLACWEEGGVATSGQRGYHLLAHLAMRGLVCFGPTGGDPPAGDPTASDPEQLLVLVEEWIPQSRRPERDEALGELALRFFRGHGPATLQDLVRWTGLRVSDARRGLELARPELVTLDADGHEHLLDPATPDRLEADRTAAAGTFLLPGFDEIVLGYGDRSAMIAPEHAGRIVPGGNGMFSSTVVHGGEVVGTWKHVGTGARRRLELCAFRPLTPDVTAAVEAAYAALP